MEKPALTRHAVHDLIARRWSPRAFADRPISRETLFSLLEAARWAPSSFNEQPWRFVVAHREDPEEFPRMLACLVPANQVWAGQAPLLVISVATTTFSHNGKPNRHAFHDVGLAAGSLTTQATAMGLAVHQMAGIDRQKIRETYAIPEGADPVAALAIGYPGDPDRLAEPLREREMAPRERKPLSELVFRGAWEEPLS